MGGSLNEPSFSSSSGGRYLTTKEQFHEFLEAEGREKPSQETAGGNHYDRDLSEPEAKRIRLEDGQPGEGATEEAAERLEQPQTPKRARGQNKARPHIKPSHYDKNRLCPSIVQVSVIVPIKSQKPSVGASLPPIQSS